MGDQHDAKKAADKSVEVTARVLDGIQADPDVCGVAVVLLVKAGAHVAGVPAAVSREGYGERLLRATEAAFPQLLQQVRSRVPFIDPDVPKGVRGA